MDRQAIKSLVAGCFWAIVFPTEFRNKVNEKAKEMNEKRRVQESTIGRGEKLTPVSGGVTV